MPGLSPSRKQQQQARRLAEAGAKGDERIKAALEPRKSPAETKPPLERRPQGVCQGRWLGSCRRGSPCSRILERSRSFAAIRLMPKSVRPISVIYAEPQ